MTPVVNSRTMCGCRSSASRRLNMRLTRSDALASRQALNRNVARPFIDDREDDKFTWCFSYSDAVGWRRSFQLRSRSRSKSRRHAQRRFAAQS